MIARTALVPVLLLAACAARANPPLPLSPLTPVGPRALLVSRVLRSPESSVAVRASLAPSLAPSRLPSLASTGAWTPIALEPGYSPQTFRAGISTDGSVCGEVFVGFRELRSDDLGRVDEQLVTGCRLSATDDESGLGIEIGFQGSSDEEGRDDADEDGAFSSRLEEFYLGIFSLIGGGGKGFHPYVGVGFSFIETRTDIFSGVDGVAEDATVLGAYVDLGVALIFEDGFRLSLDWRTLRGTETGSGADADYDQLALVVGISF